MDTMDLFCKSVPAIKVLQYYYLAILQQFLWILWICSASLIQPLKFYNITIWQFCNNFYGHMDLFCKPVPAIKVLLYYYLAILQQSLWTLWICSASLIQPLKFYNITIWQFCNNFYGHMDLFCKPVPAIKVLQYYYLAILQQFLWILWICSASLIQPLKFYNITIWQFCNNFYGHMDLFCKPDPAIKVLQYYYLAILQQFLWILWICSASLIQPLKF